MTNAAREYGAGPERPRGGGARHLALVVLESAPPPDANPLPAPLVAADLVLDRAMLDRALKDPGAPAPLLPPVSAEKAEQLAAALRERGLSVRAVPADSWARLILRAPTRSDALEEALEQALAFLLRGGLWEPERHGLAAALREMVDNAALHGNQGHEDATVALDLLVDGRRLELAVTDEGAGFSPAQAVPALAADPAAPAAPADPTSRTTEQAHKAVTQVESRTRGGSRGGLGLLMLAGWADKLWWRDGGRTAVVEKTRAEPPPPAGGG